MCIRDRAFIALLKEQKTAVRALKANEKEQQKHKAELLEAEPMLKDLDLNFSDAMQFDKKAQKLVRVIGKRRTEFRRLRREKGRLDAWVRISSNPSPHRNKNRGQKGGGKKRSKSGSADWKPRNNGPRPEDVQQRAASGGTLSLTDLDAPGFAHGGGTVAYSGDNVIEPGEFTYQSPCPPNGSHDYEWTAHTKESDGFFSSSTSSATSKQSYP